MASNQQTTLSLAALGSMLLLGGCGDSGDKAKRHAQEECFHRMMLMSAAGCSYLLEHRFSGTNMLAVGGRTNIEGTPGNGILCPCFGRCIC